MLFLPFYGHTKPLPEPVLFIHLFERDSSIVLYLCSFSARVITYMVNWFKTKPKLFKSPFKTSLIWYIYYKCVLTLMVPNEQ